MPQLRTAIAAAFVIAAFATPASAAEPGPEARMVALANDSRAAAGLAPLRVDAELAASARSHALVMQTQGRLHHSGPRAADARWWRFAENVGVGFDLEEVHDAFMQSAGHRGAVLGGYDRVGAGVVADGPRVWVVVQFGQLRHREPPAPGPGDRPGVALVDMATARWGLPGGRRLTYGNPGDHPIAGDWDCDGVDTPGLYRRSDGFVYLRNANSSGIADVRYYFGDPGDVPVAGDFDGDGCDTVGLYRPATGVFYVIDRLGAREAGLGAADEAVRLPAIAGGWPLAADFDGDGRDDPAVHDPATGRVVVAASAGGLLPRSYGDPGDVLVAGDFDGDGIATLAAWRPSTGVLHFERMHPIVAGRDPATLPVAGSFGG